MRARSASGVQRREADVVRGRGRLGPSQAPRPPGTSAAGARSSATARSSPRWSSRPTSRAGSRSSAGDWQEVILESAAEGIIGLDAEGCVTFANSAAGELLGAGHDELLGRSIHDLVHADHADRPAHAIGECPVLLSMRHGIVQHLEDDVFWRRDGSSFPVRYTSSPILQRGELMGAVLTFNDVTERKRFEAQLQYLADHDADDRPLQPAPVRAGARAPARLRRALRHRRRGARARPRQLQVHQRHARPQGGRRGDLARRANRRPSACARPTRSRASAATSS